MSAHLLAIDAGTGSCRAVLFDAQAQQVGVSLREWRHEEPPGVPNGQDFAVEHNWSLIGDCVREVLARADVAGDGVVAVSMTSMREGIVLFDEAGKEIWACPNVDSRAGAEADELVCSGQAETIYRTAGDWVSITSPARLRWLTRHRPDVLERTSSVGLLSDWIAYRLTGVHVTEPSCGSSSGMFDLSERSWSPAIAELCGLPSRVLPPIVEPGQLIGEVNDSAAAATGLRKGTPVIAGGADTQLGLAGAGIGVNQLAVVAGTFWQTTMLIDTPLIDPAGRLRTLCHVTPGQWMLEGIGFYSGMSMRWLRDALCAAEVAEAAARDVDPYVVMEERAAKIPAGANGVLAILSNVMNSRRWVHASPSFLQFNLGDPAGTGIGAFVRAIEESGAYVARAHRDIIRELTGASADVAVFTGGAAKGALWPQIMADVLGTPVRVPTVTESSALGAALFAGVGIGLFASIDAAPGVGQIARTVQPDPASVAVYDDEFGRWQAIYESQLAISERGLLRPLWRAAGADAQVGMQVGSELAKGM